MCIGQPHANINGNCVLLITGELFSLEEILMLTSDFSIGTQELWPAKASLRKLFNLPQSFQILHKC